METATGEAIQEEIIGFIYNGNSKHKDVERL